MFCIAQRHRLTDLEDRVEKNNEPNCYGSTKKNMFYLFRMSRT
jgi:hypothetical protein